MQTLLPTPNDLAPKQTQVLHQRPDSLRITSRTDRSSFTQLMKQLRRSDPPGVVAADGRAGLHTPSAAARDHGESKPASTNQPAVTRGRSAADGPNTRSKAPEPEPSTPSDSVDHPAQNDGHFAQGLHADSAVSGEVNVSKEPARSIDPNTVKAIMLPNIRTDAATVERSDALAPTTASPAGAPETALGPNSGSSAADGAAVQTSTRVANKSNTALRIGVVDDQTQIGAQVTAGSASSGSEQSDVTAENRVPEPPSDSAQASPKTKVTDDTVSPQSPSPDQSGNGQAFGPSAASGERGAASHEARPLDINRGPQDGARLQFSTPQSQSETSQDSRSNDGQSQQRSDQFDRSTSSAESTQRAPASARAVQIDAAVRVENATGQSAPVQLTVSLPAGSLSPTNTTTGVTKELPTPSTPTRSADPSNDPFTARILRGLSATLNQRGGVLTMRLEPPQLGQLRIQMTITQGTVSAEFQASTPQAQALLERSLAVLRSALQGHGLTVERLTVHTTPQANAQVMRHDSPEQQTQHSREEPDAGKGESRGRRDGHEPGSSDRHAPRPTTEYTAFDVSPQPAGAD